MTAAVAPLLEEVAARLPTDGRERAKGLALYQVHQDSDDLEALAPLEYLHMLCAARKDWEARAKVRYHLSRKATR